MSKRHIKKRGVQTTALLLTAAMMFNMQGTAVFATDLYQVSQNDTSDEYVSANNISSNDIHADDLVCVTDEVAASITLYPANPVHHCDKKDGDSDYGEWSYIYFGSYPQSEVTDAAIKNAIDAAITAAGLVSSGEGIDVMISGNKYRRISEDDCNKTWNFDKVENNGFRYFKWEPIRWKVLQNDGSALFVVADCGLDCKDYRKTSGDVGVTWETSYIRNWLNDVFYQNAFTKDEQKDILLKTIVNKDNPEYGTKGGNDTTDRIYLLSRDEAMNENYGFCSDSTVESVSRRITASDYTNAMGALTGGTKNGWILRSPGNDKSNESYINPSGDFATFFYYVYYGAQAILPAMNIRVSSELWHENADGTGGYRKPVTSITLSGISNKIAAGKKIQLTADIEPLDAFDKNLTWISDNTKYATVDVNGNVTVTKAGAGKTVTITATADDGGGAQASYPIKIMKDAVKSIKLSVSSQTAKSAKNIRLKAGKSIKIKAIVKTTGKKANKKLLWNSSNTKYAIVSTNGKVTAKKAGKGKTVTITAQATDGSNKKAKIKIKIK